MTDFPSSKAQGLIGLFILQTTVWEDPGTYWWDDIVDAKGVLDTEILDKLKFATDSQKILQDNVKYLKREWDVKLATTTIKEEIKFDRDLLRGYCQSDYPRFSITIESGIQNGTLAFVIATSILNNVEMGIPAGVYAIWMFITGGILMWQLGKRTDLNSK